MIKKWPLALMAVLASLVVSSVQAAECNYSREDYYGQPMFDGQHKLQFVAENASQNHSQEEYVMIHIKNINVRPNDNIGRVRVAVWDSPGNFAKEGVCPLRGSSHWAKDANSGEMIFKIGGLTRGKKYSFFAHFDQNNDGIVTKNFFGIPTEQYLFSNAENQGRGAGLTREGLSAPKFNSTLVTYTGPGQVIFMPF